MSGLQDYLVAKRDAILRRQEAARTNGPGGPHTLLARVRTEARSGVRRIRIRDFQILSDSAPDFAGYDLGPGSPELHQAVERVCPILNLLVNPQQITGRIQHTFPISAEAPVAASAV